MFWNYLATAIRNLLKHKLFSMINIVGLAIGLSSCILILLYVKDELSYDEFLPDTANVYRLDVTVNLPGGPPAPLAFTQGPVLELLREDFPEIDEAARIAPFGDIPILHGDRIFSESTVFADPALLEVLPYPLLAGDAATALQDPNSAIVGAAAAERLFGNAPAIGETFSAVINGEKYDFKITAIMRDIPETAHLKFDFLMPLRDSYFPDNPFGPNAPYNWTVFAYLTYLKFEPGTDVGAFQAAMPGFVDRHLPARIAERMSDPTHEGYRYAPVPLRDLHLYGATATEPPGDPVMLAAFTAISILVLGIASTNFVNLATARSTQRAREVAIRKAVGARKMQLVTQFLSESTLTVVMAVLLSAALVELALPYFRDFLDASVGAAYLRDPVVLAGLIGLVIVVGIGAGSYPAFLLSSFRPADALKADRPLAPGSARLRSVLVIVQFSISIGLIVGTVVLFSQTHYALSRDAGFDKENLLVVRGLAGPDLPARETFMQRVGARADVVNVANSNVVPGDGYPMSTRVTLPGHEERLSIGYVPVGFNFFETYRIAPLAGRVFSEEYATDPAIGHGDARQRAVANTVINESAMRQFGFSSPAQALGMVVTAGINFRTEFTIVGVIPDLYFASTRQDIRPELYVLSVNGGSVTIRYKAGELPGLLADVDDIWSQMMPDQTISRVFLDDNIHQLYEQDQQTGTLLAAFAGLAVVISCLGLFGLAAFSVERRTKEIGIRKVMGASVLDIVRLMVWEYSRPILVANAIAWPVTWYLAREWLEGFADRIELTIIPFAVAGGAALAIAWVTVASHAIMSARANPIHALKYE